MSSLTLNHLFQDLQLEIISHCTPLTEIILGMTCKLFNSLCKHTPKFFSVSELAASEGNIPILHKFNHKWDLSTCYVAVKNGQLECLKYLISNNCKISLLILGTSARYGHLDCLKYLHQNVSNINASTALQAAIHGHFECLKYCIENGSGWYRNTGNLTLIQQYPECYNYLKSKNLL
jgi:hypothetical protein